MHYFKSCHLHYSLQVSTLAWTKSSLKYFWYEYLFKLLYAEEGEKFQRTYQYAIPHTYIYIYFMFKKKNGLFCSSSNV